ncbi:winged helix DNA-binding domain-containing protein [Egibacter rhizosphaerae]|uniref:Winged helix DNA-binding domain-containing protein n=1 Tax=Egibacter rhizosphaerae TaxID=1670831 RepID=A0A411YEE9_9ACTN|nr:crosslink repair DNA glycosylase YcaQ family protein [Egibacter rhizosphaerae]QBI19595.1 winged helix DNA-binding domain-containing protein [Egibacter rhizosphaerae]
MTDRRHVLARRAAVQGLHRHERRGEAEVPDLRVLDLGVQDTPPGSAAQALAIRLGRAPPGAADDDRLAVTWTFRGAPHVHRADDLLPLSRALWPVSEDDALTRLDTSASPLRGMGMTPRQALRFVAQQVREVVTEPMAKGEVSAALTPRVPAELTMDCQRCEATHIIETLFRSAMLPAGLSFVPGRKGVVFAPIPGWPGPPEEAEAPAHLLRAYLHLHGPATLAEAASFLGARGRDLQGHVPADAVDVEVTSADGAARPALALREDLEALREPPDPPPLRLLPPSDPFLQARDRHLLVPEDGLRASLWPSVGRPGAVLAEGELVGIWRARRAGKRLEVDIESADRLPDVVRPHLDAEVELIAEARGAHGATVAVR